MISYNRNKRRVLRSRKNKLLKKTFSQVPKRSRQRSSSFKFKFVRTLTIILFLLLSYIILFHPFLQIKKVIIVDQKLTDDNKLEGIAESVLNKRRYFVFPGRNIFIFDKRSVENSILENNPEIDSLEIVKKYPDILKIKVKEAEPEALWKSRDEYYYLDHQGVVRGKVENPESLIEEGVFVIVDQNNKEVSIKENVVYTKHLNFIKILYEKLPEYNIEIEEIILPSALADEIHVKTTKGWRAFFILDREAEHQISNLNLVLEKEIADKIPEENLDYIDLRVESWVYYREKREEPVEEVGENEEVDEENVESINLEE